jgi:phosphoribosylaminoimidazolecarboxamide formyltransferase/IMP cyclohydrolase
MKKLKIESALISVFNKEGISEVCMALFRKGITIYSTGGTKKFIENLDIPVKSVESLTGYPSILGGRVKTLHPKIFGSILSRSSNKQDLIDQKTHAIPKINLVIVDLYPFKETVIKIKDKNEIIEKIDIGGVSLIRAAAKNYDDVLVVSSRNQYIKLLEDLESNNFITNEELRKNYAAKAFKLVTEYDRDISNYFNESFENENSKILRYGENPHQSAVFKGNISDVFSQLHGKDLSYNNLLDVDSAIKLITEFTDTTFAIIKHNNACGIGSALDVVSSYDLAFSADSLSAFGGVLISNKEVDILSAKKMNTLFFEIIIAPSYQEKALTILKSKKNRIILVQKRTIKKERSYKSILNGRLEQDVDNIKNDDSNWDRVTKMMPSNRELKDLEFANKVVKHSKSNSIVLVKNLQMISSGVGQTSRIDALNFAIDKARRFGFSTKGSVMASDAFFPFPDCVEIAAKSGISSIIQPGGSIKDNLSIEMCDKNNISMVFSGIRHFYH